MPRTKTDYINWWFQHFSEIEDIFKKFYTMLETQFQENIIIFKSDNEKEYFHKVLRKFLEKKV